MMMMITLMIAADDVVFVGGWMGCGSVKSFDKLVGFSFGCVEDLK